ncbi:ElyC/SanA/YdcF family protein [Zobellella sp. DQSA1]|uniref:ElyC/SanA/YdcF family protein n=1 Tax=Zobellella sp. DQSA1 TaxID=3342386 RepID=UPI0035C0CB9F
MFLAKKWLGSLLLPLPLLLFLGFWGLFLLLLRHKRSGIGLLVLSLGTLLLLATRPVANALMAPLESRYPPHELTAEPVQDIIVLGAAQVADPRLPLLSQLGQAGLYRIAEGVRLAHAYPQARLILSGYAGGEGRTSAELYGEVAVALGIARQRLLMLPKPKDTAEEARAIAPLILHRRAVLVTSASHMPRAMALFAAAGAAPLAAPVDHQVRESGAALPLYTYLPRARYLWRSEQAWHEYLGLWWQRLGRTEVISLTGHNK